MYLCHCHIGLSYLLYAITVSVLFFKIILHALCFAHVCVHMHHIGSTEARRGHRSPEVGNTDVVNCHVGAGN